MSTETFIHDSELPSELCTEPDCPDHRGEVAMLVNAAHRFAKWTITMEGEEGGAFVHALREANQAKLDVLQALIPFGVTVYEPPPSRRTAVFPAVVPDPDDAR